MCMNWSISCPCMVLLSKIEFRSEFLNTYPRTDLYTDTVSLMKSWAKWKHRPLTGIVYLIERIGTPTNDGTSSNVTPSRSETNTNASVKSRGNRKTRSFSDKRWERRLWRLSKRKLKTSMHGKIQASEDGTDSSCSSTLYVICMIWINRASRVCCAWCSSGGHPRT